MKKASVIILAAGESSRMGMDKASLNLRNGKRFLDHLVEEYRAVGISDIFIIHQPRMDFEPYFSNQDIHLIPNHHIGRGRSWSIYLGLQQLKKGEATFIQNVDNPFTTRSLIAKMLKNAEPNRILIPQYKGKNAHPIYLPSSYISLIKKNGFEYYDFRTSIESWPTKTIPWKHEEIRANINTQKDYHKWIGLPTKD